MTNALGQQVLEHQRSSGQSSLKQSWGWFGAFWWEEVDRVHCDKTKKSLLSGEEQTESEKTCLLLPTRTKKIIINGASDVN